MRRATEVLFAMVATLLASTASAVIPTPAVTGPIPSETPGSPSRNYTWWATDIVLEKYGYVEQEFFFDGLANRYDAPNPAGFARCTAMANIVESNIPFRSRMRVIRPTDPAKFNGTVVEDESHFIRLLSDAKIGSTASLTALREGREQTVRVPIVQATGRSRR